MLGFGGSSRTAPELGMPAQAEALKALLDREGVERVDLVGNSVGGWVTATPDRSTTDPRNGTPNTKIPTSTIPRGRAAPADAA